nr:hypothetical protein [Fodinicurvata fenggangensis]
MTTGQVDLLQHHGQGVDHGNGDQHREQLEHPPAPDVQQDDQGQCEQAQPHGLAVQRITLEIPVTVQPQQQTEAHEAQDQADHDDGQPGYLSRQIGAQAPQQEREGHFTKTGEDGHPENQRQPAGIGGREGCGQVGRRKDGRAEVTTSQHAPAQAEQQVADPQCQQRRCDHRLLKREAGVGSSQDQKREDQSDGCDDGNMLQGREKQRPVRQ